MQTLVPRTQHAAARGAKARRGSSGVLRAGALAVCVLALATIVVAGGIIYLLGGPRADSNRVLLKRAIASLWSSSER